jgi:hypothetical protein
LIKNELKIMGKTAKEKRTDEEKTSAQILLELFGS